MRDIRIAPAGPALEFSRPLFPMVFAMMDGIESDLACGCVAIRSDHGWLLGESLVEPIPLTILAVVSDDPDSWDEMLQLWPRHRTPVVPELLSAVPLQPASVDQVRRAIAKDPFYVLIDLCQKRVATGREYPTVKGGARFNADINADGKPRYPIGIDLSPWWELLENIDENRAFAKRQTSPCRPSADRELLFGDTMLRAFATALVASFEKRFKCSGSIQAVLGIAAESCHKRQEIPYELLKQIHRDWLMTPRHEFDGRIPRQLLHGCHDWIESLTTTQQYRFQDGLPIVATPSDLSSVTAGPMGLSEMVMYFDLCREVIRAGWRYLDDKAVGSEGQVRRYDPQLEREHLVALMRGAADEWMGTPFEGGSPPRFIIECDRRRVPRAVDVPIEGMEEQETEQHVPDCDCPICEMMADGSFGPAFTSLSGYHLDLDDEFAFSIHETLDAWKEMQCEFDEFCTETCDDRRASGPFDEFVSVWNGIGDDGPIPGDSGGHLKLAFLLGEFLGDLEQCGVDQDVRSRLNAAFKQFRNASLRDRESAARALDGELQAVEAFHPFMIPKVADFRSRIDELLRQDSPPQDKSEAPH